MVSKHSISIDYCEESSETLKVTHGISQGSILGPKLFIIYVNYTTKFTGNIFSIFVVLFVVNSCGTFLWYFLWYFFVVLFCGTFYGTSLWYSLGSLCSSLYIVTMHETFLQRLHKNYELIAS